MAKLQIECQLLVGLNQNQKNRKGQILLKMMLQGKKQISLVRKNKRFYHSFVLSYLIEFHQLNYCSILRKHSELYYKMTIKKMARRISGDHGSRSHCN